MLTNPLTWIIALIGVLIVVIDDLVTYLRGGESSLGAFWKPLIEYTKIAWEWITKLYNAFVNSTAFKAFSLAYSSNVKHLINGLSQLWDLCVKVFDAIMTGGEDLNGLTTIIVGVFTIIGGTLETLFASVQLLFGAFVAVFTGDTEALKNAWIVVCDGVTTASKGAFKVIEGIFKSVKDLFTEIVDVINRMIDAILNFGSSIAKALNIDGLVDKAKGKLTNILPDWMKSKIGISNDQGGNKEPTIYEGTDAPIVPDVQNMQAINAQSKGNVNNNINRSQVINVGSNNPAVVTATMREADYEMNNADSAIAMASQGAGW